MNFCYLEKDPKTFEYFKEYLSFLEEKNGTCLSLDNDIQLREMRQHLDRNGLTEDNCDAIIDWVKNNGENFRNYLNSIKIAYVVWKCMGYKWDELDWNNFCDLEEKINGLKNRCLDTIF